MVATSYSFTVVYIKTYTGNIFYIIILKKRQTNCNADAITDCNTDWIYRFYRAHNLTFILSSSGKMSHLPSQMRAKACHSVKVKHIFDTVFFA